MQIEELRQIFLTYLSVSNQRNVTAMRTYYSPNLRINDVPKAPAAVTDSFTDLWNGFPDWTWNARHVTIEDNYIAVQYNQSGTHTGTYLGVPPTGRHVTASEFSLYLYDEENGYFTDIWDLDDSATILAQITA